MDAIFDSTQRKASDELIRHAMGRIVYGAFLASNSAAYLRGEADALDYYFDEAQSPGEATERIADYWRERWLLSRLSHAPALERLSVFEADTLRVSQDLPEAQDLDFQPIRDTVIPMTSTPNTSHGAMNFAYDEFFCSKPNVIAATKAFSIIVAARSISDRKTSVLLPC